MQSRETQITMVKWTDAGGQTKRANERSFAYRPPVWRRWRNVKTTYRKCCNTSAFLRNASGFSGHLSWPRLSKKCFRSCHLNILWKTLNTIAKSLQDMLPVFQCRARPSFLYVALCYVTSKLDIESVVALPPCLMHTWLYKTYKWLFLFISPLSVR